MRGLKTKLVLIGIALFALSVPLPTLEYGLYDFKVSLRSDAKQFSSPIVIVAIDEESLQEQGHWPWPRERLTTLLKTLMNDYQATAVGLNILLPENGQKQQDKMLTDLINTQPITPSLAFNLHDRLYSGYLNHGIEADALSKLLGVALNASQAKGWVGLFDDLAQTINLPGHLNSTIDADGKTRRVPLFIEAQKMIYPQMTLAMLYNLLEAQQDTGVWQATLPNSQSSSVLIPFDFPSELIPVISAQAIFAKTAPEDLFENSLVLIGATAIGVGNMVATPLSNQLPSVYLQAYLLNSALNQRWLEPPPLEHELTTLGFVLWTLLLILFAERLRSLVLFGLMIGAFSTLFASNLWQFIALGVHWDFSPWLLLFSGHLLWLMYQRYQLQAQRSKDIEKMFKSYVPPMVLQKLIAGQFEHLEQGERRKITVMFIDLVAFTQLAENSDPRQLTQLTRSIFNTLTPVILSHQGTIDKYMGDSIMAFWGAPLEDNNQAQNAVLAAIEMRQKMASQFPQIDLGIGIHTGEAIVGNMGSDFRHAYSALGDTVNIAARIERQTRRYPHAILLSRQTALESGLITEWVDDCQLKGKQQCVSLYTLAS